MIPLAGAENLEENAHFENCAAPGAAPEMHNVLIDPELQSVIERWPNLPATLKAGILAMVESCTDR